MIVHLFKQYSDEWWATRLGKPSASCASKLITSTGAESKSLEPYAIELGADLYAGKSLNTFTGNEHTAYGTETEEEARLEYQLLTQQVVTEIGMVTDNLSRYLASPDGVVNKNLLLEIKCLSPKVHVKALMYFEKTGKCPPDYISQTQMQMFVYGAKACDLFLYHADLPSLIIRQTPIPGFSAKLKKQLNKCILQRDLTVKLLNEASEW